MAHLNLRRITLWSALVLVTALLAIFGAAATAGVRDRERGGPLLVFARVEGTTPTPSPIATTAPGPDGFTVVASPNNGGGINELFGVAARNANDTWAVGHYTSAGIPRTLALHWNGSAWSIAPTPNQGVGHNTLQAVAARASDAWAVGYYKNSGGVMQTLALRWNGSQWAIISTPDQGSGDTALYGVTMLAGGEAWAAGYYTDANGVMQTLIQRWNGSAWRIVASPNNAGALNRLFAIAATAINNAWATGVSVDGSGASKPLLERWNGAAWSIQPFEGFAAQQQQQLNGVSALDGGNAFTAGYYFPPDANTESLAPHLSGGNWTTTGGPNAMGVGNALQGVSGVAATNAWAAGTQYNAGFLPRTLLMHYDGSVWRRIISPNQGNGANYLNGVAALSSDVWAVGSYNDAGGSGRTLILHGGG